MTRSCLVRALIWRVSGVSWPLSTWSIPEMWPTSVSIPVAVTTNRPEPRVTFVFMNAMPCRSPSGASAATGVDVLGHREALAGEGRLVDLERRGGDDPAVRGDEVAGLEGDDVARDQLLRRHLDELAVPPHARLDDHHLLERRDGGRRLALLVQAEVGVEDREQDQQDPGGDLLDRVDAQDAGDQQDDLHRVGVLAQEGPPGGAPASAPRTGWRRTSSAAP